MDQNEYPTLTHLDLEGNEISVNGAIALANCIAERDCTLRHLNLSWNLLTAEGGHELARGLEVLVLNCRVLY